MATSTFTQLLSSGVVHEQMRGDKECPYSGVTSCGSLEEGWRKARPGVQEPHLDGDFNTKPLF